MKGTICISADGYPYGDNSEFSFVKELCEELVRQGIDVTVISPQNLLGIIIHGRKKLPVYYENREKGYGAVKIYRPLSWTLSSRFPKFQYWMYSRSIRKTISKEHLNFDVFYGHFWHCAFQLFPIAKQHKKPLFVATGESHIFFADAYKPYGIRNFLDYITTVICVSSKNKEESISLGYCTSNKCVVLPNGINNRKFYPSENKMELRRQFNLPIDKFLIAFIGAFIERKGADRVSEAIIRTGDPTIKAIYIGKPQEGNIPHNPNPSTSVFTGYIPHEKIREMLCCADVFVLPTYQEGCCNAIIEAMACGLPIISSDRSFNYDILDETNSIMIDPSNINDISQAIMILKSDENLRNRLRIGSIKKSNELSISQRTMKIKNILFGN